MTAFDETYARIRRDLMILKLMVLVTLLLTITISWRLFALTATVSDLLRQTADLARTLDTLAGARP